VDPIVVAVVGDSISAGSPLSDRDERSQWQWWAAARDARLRFRTHAVYGKRTDEIAHFVDDVVVDADVLVVQGGINDIAQGRPVEQAARNLAGIVEHGLRLGLPVALADVLPWPRGDARAAGDILRLNELVRAIPGVTLLPFHDTLAPLDGSWSDDGDHPSVEGYRLLGEQAFRLPSELDR
jgi:lysophospholipase L1-like esterase